jgi:glycosyltransferase involved in cell wall biosynthesis
MVGTMGTNMKIIAGIPAYNKQYPVCGVIHATKDYVDEILVVDDGSTDDTSKLAKRSGAVVIKHKTNQGKTAAIQTIIDAAIKRDADVLVLLDSDGQHDPDEIPALVKPILEDGYDFVLGSRRLKKSKKKGKKPFIRPFGQFVLKVSLGTITKKKYTDPECGFRALSRRAMEAMEFKGNGFSVEAEMIRLAEAHGLKSIEVPMTEIYVKDGSTLNPWKHGFGNLGTIISWIAEGRPLFFFGMVGVGFTVIGLLLGAKVLYIANNSGGVAVGSALASVLYIIIGVFSMFTGLILNEIQKGKEDRNG